MLEVAQEAMHGRGKRAKIEHSESDSLSDDDEIEKLISKKSLRQRKRKRDIGIEQPVDIFGQANQIEKLISKKSLRQRKSDIGIEEPVDIFGQAWH